MQKGSFSSTTVNIKIKSVIFLSNTDQFTSNFSLHSLKNLFSKYSLKNKLQTCRQQQKICEIDKLKKKQCHNKSESVFKCLLYYLIVIMNVILLLRL